MHSRCTVFWLLLLGTSQSFLLLSPQKSTLNRFPIAPVLRTRNLLALDRDPPGTRLGLSSKWEGDDLRWSSKLRRRFMVQRRLSIFRPWLIWSALSLFMYTYQAITTILSIRHQFPAAWDTQSFSIIVDTLLGISRPGHLTMQLAATSNSWQMTTQSYRFLISGVLHDSLIHLGLVYYAFVRLPTWLDTGLGNSLYWTTMVVSTIAGNWSVLAMHGSEPCVLGATAGIAGLYGLLYVCLIRMGNPTTTLQVGKGLGLLFLYGILLPHVSNLAHIGGFLGGVVLGVMAGPSYRKSYMLRRKNSVAADMYSRDYRSAMGYDTMPSKPMVPLPFMWAAALLFVVSKWKTYQSVPTAVLSILANPMMR